MSDEEIRLYAAIRTRVHPRIPINIRDLTVTRYLDRDSYVIGYRGLHFVTLMGVEIYGP